MSNSKLNLGTDVIFASAKSTHYMVSTFAAVVYAVVWMLSNGVHAETAAQSNYAVLEPVYVTASAPAVLDPVVVVATRDASMKVAMLDAVVVTAKRERPEQLVSASFGSPVAAASSVRVGYVVKFRNWVRSTMAKVSG